MIKLFTIFMLSALMVITPAVSFAAEAAKAKPPVSQTLVREGNYAVRLAETLKLGKMSEVQAESKLASLGVAPLSGWISDFPVTPDIVAEVHSAVKKSAEDKKLPMSPKKAEELMARLDTSFGLPVVAAQSETPSQGYQSWQESSQYPSTVINNYYYTSGPPVVTYYPPPYDYSYLYAWDPFPFWWGGFWFPGFYILTDFDCDVEVDNFGVAFVGEHFEHGRFEHRRFETGIISNHIVDPRTRAVMDINPVTRVLPASIARTIPGARTTLANRAIQTRRMAALRTSLAPVRTRSGAIRLHKGAITSNGARRFDASRARGIYNRSIASARLRPSVTTRGVRSFSGVRSPGRAHFNAIPSHGRVSPNIGRSPGRFSGGHGARAFNRAPTFFGGSRGFSSHGPIAPNRSFSAGRSFSRAAPSIGRSFGGARSFGGGHAFAGARSFGGGFGGGRSFGGGQTFAGGRSFGGGFAGGHSFGGGRR